MKLTEQLTRNDVEVLRNKPYGTNGNSITVTEQEVKDTKKQLEKLYTGRVQMNYAEKIALRNKEW